MPTNKIKNIRITVTEEGVIEEMLFNFHGSNEEEFSEIEDFTKDSFTRESLQGIHDGVQGIIRVYMAVDKK